MLILYILNCTTILFIIFNNNGESNLDNKMVINMLEKIKVPNNLEVDACKRICSNTDGHNFQFNCLLVRPVHQDILKFTNQK